MSVLDEQLPTGADGPTMRDFADPATTRRAIYDNVLTAFRGIKPVSNSRYSLELADIDYDDPEDYPLAKQKQAILSGGSLHRRIRGTWRLKTPDGSLVDEKKATLAQVPYMTPRGTFVLNGTEYGLCLHPSVLVWTENGLVTIGEIVNKRLQIRVWSYNFATDGFELRPVVGWYKNRPSSRLSRARFNGNGVLKTLHAKQSPTTLWATPNHQVYTVDGDKTALQHASQLAVVEERLTEVQMQVLYGGLLGDSTLAEDGTLRFVHGLPQEDYLRFKHAVFSPLSDKGVYYYRRSDGKLSVKCDVGATAETQRAFTLCYPEGVKTVSQRWLDLVDEAGLAVWYGDDGSVHRQRGMTIAVRLHTQGFTRDGVALLIRWLWQRWRLRATSGRDQKLYAGRDMGWIIRLDGEEAERFLDIVAPYLPAVLHYKLGDLPAAKLCATCGRRVARRQGVCNACALEAARQAGSGSLPRTARDRFGGSIGVRRLLAAGIVPPDKPDRYLVRLENRLKSAGTRTAALMADNQPTYVLSRRDFVLDEPEDMQYSHSPYAYDIQVEGLHNYVANGVLVSNSHQMRLRPGVFTREKESGEIESHLNVIPGKGISHRYFLEPKTGVFKISLDQSSMPLLPVLRAMGVSDKELRDAWGNDLYAANLAKDDPRVIDKLYLRLVKKADPQASNEVKRQAVVAAMNAMEFDPEVTRRTLGGDYRSLNRDAALAATRKLLAVSRGEAEQDDRDHLAYQNFYGPEDLFAERVRRSGMALNQLLWKATHKGNLSHIQPGALSKQVQAAILDSGLGNPPEEINASEILDHQTRVSRMGVGGIADISAIPDSSRAVHPSQLVYIDTVRTPESLKAGVDTRVAFSARKGSDNKIYARFNLPDGREVWRSPQDVAELTIAFPGEIENGRPLVAAMVKGRVKLVPRESVELVMPHFENAFSPVSNMVPLKSMSKGQRVAMGSRFLTQALPLKDAEAPLVQSGTPDEPGVSFEDRYGRRMGAVFAGNQTGRVRSVTPDGIVVQYADGSTVTHDLYNNFPYARKSFVHSTPLVTQGDPVRPGQLLARSNQTDDKGTAALGKNLRVGYMSFRGLNFEDAIVISESAAHKLNSEHMYQHEAEFDKDTRKGKNAYVSIFPARFDRKVMENIDDDGVVKPGTLVREGDPLVLAAQPRQLSHRQVHSAHKGTFSDRSVVWDHHNDGVVTDVAKTPKGVVVAVKSYAPMQVADKLANRYGGKGVISAVVPDDEMPTDAEGRPLEVILNPLGIISRGNPSQVVETVLGKIAEKTGRPYKLRDFGEEKDWTAFARRELDRHGLTDVEDFTDPETGRKIPGILTGKQFFLKLHHMAEPKSQGRGLGAYSADEMPAKGSGEGGQSKRLALMDVNALLSHGSTEVLRDAKLIRGQKNQEYWSTFMSGMRPPTPRVPLVYEKFINQLKGAGINVVREGSKLHLFAMTDADVDEMSDGRELKNVDTVDWKDGLKPVQGGLFDPTLTGGHGGQRWSFVKLDEAMPNPVMEEPIRRLLGLTQKKFEAVLSGKDRIGEASGPEAIGKALAAIDVDKALAQARADVKSGKKGERDAAVKRLGYLITAKKTGVHPSAWMMGKLPVLPPAFRPVSIMQGSGGQLVADANYLYKEVWDANENLKSLRGEVGDLADERLTLYNSLKAVTGLGDPVQPKNQERKVKGLLQQIFGWSPKHGIVQYKLLGANMDLVGRAVITPNPDLGIDEVGLPEEKAWSVYTPFVVRRLVRRGLPRLTALQYVKDRHQIARDALLQEVGERPVIVTRAPVLHRFGEMAFWPKLTKSHTLQVPPTMVGPFGADFDGDQQLGLVYIAIDRTLLNTSEWIAVNEQTTLKDHQMPFAPNLRLPVLDANDDLYLFNLEDFPHVEQVDETRGQFGRIEWYRVPDGVKVLSHRPDGRLCWSPVSRWSKHHGCPVEVVNLRSGRQIFTDNDPRAVYGVSAGSLCPTRFRPDAAVAAKALVPRVIDVPDEALPASRPPVLSTRPYLDEDRRCRLHLSDELPLSEDFGYFIGCAAGDGWSPEMGRDFCLAGITEAIVEKVDRIVASFYVGKGPTYHTEAGVDSYGESRRHTWTSKSLSLMVADLIGRGSRYKHLPVWFLKTSREFRLGLFAGIMDTDGSVSVSNGKARPQLMSNVTSTSLRLLQEVSLLALSLGIHGRITVSKTPAGKPCWVWTPSNYDIGRWGGRGMVHPDKLAAFAHAPLERTPALVRHDLVPCPFSLAAAICKAMPTPADRKKWPPGQQAVYSAFHQAKTRGYVTRATAERVGAFLPDGKVSHPEWDAWLAVVAATHVTWDPVVSVDKTGVVEVGYDLTVPGAETFMASDGVILSNTSNYYVPASDEARDEAVAKMLPSKNLFSTKNFKADLWTPRQEYVGGLWAATAQVDKSKKPRTFAKVGDVLRAFRRGKIDVDQQVDVVED